MLADHRDGLLNSSFSLILDSSVGLSAGIQSAADSVPETLVRILDSAEEDNLSPFDSKIPCLCQSIKDTKVFFKSTDTHKLLNKIQLSPKAYIRWYNKISNYTIL